MTQSFDLIVIGVGMAAVAAAEKCAAAGWSVAVIDELPYGGTCALRGCDPKKLLRRGAEIINNARLMRGKGVEDDGVRINWRELVAFKRSFTDRIPDRIEGNLDRNGVSTFHGHARFANENTVEIDGRTRLQGRFILIASGAEPRPLDMSGADHVSDSTSFMELDDLPKRILFIGGGYISFEFAHIAVRAGSSVCIADHGSRALKGFDADLIDRLVAHNHAEPDYRGVPSVVFTIPELARVGMLEAEARDAGHDVRVVLNDTGDWFSNFRVGESCAATKIIIDAKTDTILGAHLLGPGYAELINYCGLAIRLGLKTGDLKKMVAAYPTVTSDLGSIL